MIGIITAIY